MEHLSHKSEKTSDPMTKKFAHLQSSSYIPAGSLSWLPMTYQKAPENPSTQTPVHLFPLPDRAQLRAPTPFPKAQLPNLLPSLKALFPLGPLSNLLCPSKKPTNP